MNFPPTKETKIFRQRNKTIRSNAEFSSRLFATLPSSLASFNFLHLLSAITRYMGDSFIIGFRIFLPFFACIMVLNCVLGIMARVAPQMNMFSIGMQLKILVGFVVLYLIVFLLPNVANYIFDEIKTMVKLVAEGLY